ncbi:MULTISPECIES: hypothetical protein [unclassified Rhodococcus (in: high G+C Gram-positive bacteria)]|uniref:hypothetical protein n=1 Tax=unclassified Rhodococcus (in: high G+C Gram-positive bacteria) TaxID=192944 RepID=UPI00398A24DE
MQLDLDTKVIVLVAGLLLLWALGLGVIKYHQMSTSPDNPRTFNPPCGLPLALRIVMSTSPIGHH